MKMAITCPNCNAGLPDDAVFCDQCGTSISSSPAAAAPAAPAPAAGRESTCPQCGAAAIPGEAFCDNCGASLAEPEVVATPQATPTPAAASTSPDLVQCPACGEDNLPGSKFCSNCGFNMDEPAEPVAEVEVTPEPVVEEAVAEVEAEVEPAVVEEVEPAPVVDAEPPAPTGQPRFIVRDTGAEILLPSAEGEYFIGREDPISGVFPEVDMNPYEGEHYGVSRRHAKLIIDAGLVFIEDLDSTNFTFVDRQKLAPRTPTALSNGDEVRLGKLVLTYLE